ncbi:transposase [Pseudonocardia sp. CA-142604]|uniref:transposase n=1 Tax=Pseudonocardia sp. CA-142604 TaxID=3240024 RepID=UPI003D8AD67F
MAPPAVADRLDEVRDLVLAGDAKAAQRAFSGDVVRHRLSRVGDRQLNYALHVMATTQIRHDTPGRACYRRKRAAGKSHKEALRCLKRRLSDVVYRTLVRDARAAGPGGHPGATLQSSAAGSSPTPDSSDKSLPGPTALGL